MHMDTKEVIHNKTLSRYGKLFAWNKKKRSEDHEWIRRKKRSNRCCSQHEITGMEMDRIPRMNYRQ